MLSHGSSLFALIGFAVVVLAFWAWPPLKTMIYGAVDAARALCPLDAVPERHRSARQPAAEVAFRRRGRVDDRSFGTALRDSYGALSWDDWVQGKLENLQPLDRRVARRRCSAAGGDLRLRLVGAGGHALGRLLPAASLAAAYSFAMICAVLLLPFLKAEERRSATPAAHAGRARRDPRRVRADDLPAGADHQSSGHLRWCRCWRRSSPSWC